MMVVSAHVTHGGVVTTAETVAIIIARRAIYVGMAVLFVIVRARPMVMVEVPASGFDAVMKALALHVAKIGRRLVPAALSLPVSRSLR